jgi:hypothetical protein
MGNEVIRNVLDFKGAIAKRIRLHYPGTFNLLHLTKITPNIHEFYLKVKVKVSVLLKGAIIEHIGLHYPNFLPHMFDYNKKFIRFLTFRCYVIK